MTTTTYILDSALVLLVLVQMKERVLTNRALIRPFIILAIAMFSYLKTFPTAGNDIPLVLAVTGIGVLLGLGSGLTVLMRTNADGLVTARAGLSSAAFWVAGMGARFAFAVWASTTSGTASLARFSGLHHITSAQAFTVALLGMAAGEIIVRSAVMVLRRHQLAGTGTLALA